VQDAIVDENLCVFACIMCVCVCVCIDIYIYMNVCMCIQTQTHTGTHACICSQPLHRCACVCVVCMCVDTRVRKYMNLCVQDIQKDRSVREYMAYAYIVHADTLANLLVLVGGRWRGRGKEKGLFKRT